jgi:hypothetical protein
VWVGHCDPTNTATTTAPVGTAASVVPPSAARHVQRYTPSAF